MRGEGASHGPHLHGTVAASGRGGGRRSRSGGGVALDGVSDDISDDISDDDRPASASTAAGAGHGHHDGDDNRFTQVNLVADTPGIAAITDPNLVNAWGLSQGPTTPVWVSDNGTDVSTLYTAAVQGQKPAIVPLVVKIPGGAPTGQAFNPTTSFVLPDGQPALFVFAGEDGGISAWNRAADAARRRRCTSRRCPAATSRAWRWSSAVITVPRSS